VLIHEPAQTRAANRSYYSYLDWEGYHWGGGCANNNNVDDQPGETVQQTSPRGEGPDCSGLVYRVWELADYGSNMDFYFKAQYAYVHGPFSAASFRTSTTAWTVISKSALGYMDATASTSHIAIHLGANSDGTQNYMEANSEAIGTGVFARTYKSNSAYAAVHRNNWAG
jgi:hypothetical protein